MPREIMKETEGENGPQRRRSARLSPLQITQTSAQKMAPAIAATATAGDALVKRSITVRKIAPRKTTLAPSQHNKENTPKTPVSEGVQLKKQKLSTPDNVLGQNSSSGKRPKKSTMPSPILPSPPLTAKNPKVQTPKAQASKTQTPKVRSPKAQASKTQTTKVQTPKAQATKVRTPKAQTENQDQSQQPAVDPEDAVWSNKVRRSYSRLSDKSFNSPNSRLTLFGFAKLQTPEVMRKGAGQSNKSGLNASGSFSTLTSFTSLLDDEDCEAEPDLNIPGVALVKERKRRRRKVQHIDSNDIDALAAKMNAEFDEAEGFELLVE